jgi:hypothetical protein
MKIHALNNAFSVHFPRLGLKNPFIIFYITNKIKIATLIIGRQLSHVFVAGLKHLSSLPAFFITEVFLDNLPIGDLYDVVGSLTYFALSINLG